MTDMMRRIPSDCNLIVLPDDKKQELIDHCMTLHKSRDDIALQFRAAQSFFAILDLICTCRREAPAPSTLPDSFLAIVEHISKHYTDPACTVSGLCREFYVSRSTLCRQFRTHFQMTPSDYIESKRFSEAKKRLLAGCSVQDTCFFCGFSDCSYFIKRFRNKFGMTPRAYRQGMISFDGNNNSVL
jgi:AraC-like DNA-binding protein